MPRTDNDTWDLSTSVGATATMVAAGRARATRAGFIDDRFAEPLVTAVGIDFFTRWADGDLDAAEIDIPGQPWGMQMMTDLLAARTRHIDRFLSGAADAGIRQVVILAAGLDARGYRLAWPAGPTPTIVYEIDQPAVLEFKRTTLTGLGAEPTVDLRPVPIDLRHDWPAALTEAGFDRTRPTAWVAEGLLAFLPPAAQDRLLDDITALSADGSRLVAEIFLASADSEQIQRTVTQRWYRHGLDVHLDDLAYPEQRADVATYLGEHGWQTTSIRLLDLLADAGLPVPTDSDDPSSIADNYYCTATLHR